MRTLAAGRLNVQLPQHQSNERAIKNSNPDGSGVDPFILTGVAQPLDYLTTPKSPPLTAECNLH